MKQILLLSDSCQPASHRAARHLCDALESRFPSEIRVRTVDPLAHPEPVSLHPSSSSYSRIPRHEPTAPLAELLTYSQPHAVVIFSPIYGPLVENFWRRNPLFRPPIYLATVASSELQSSWSQCHPDLFTLCYQPLTNSLLVVGIPEHELRITGPLVDPAYEKLASTLHPPDLSSSGRPHLLLFPSGSRFDPLVLTELILRPEWDFTIVAGTTPSAQKRAHRLAELAPERTRVVTARPAQFPSLALSHHLAVGAVPPHLVSELITAGLPPLVWNPNATETRAESPWNWLASQNAGVLVKNRRLLLPWIDRAIGHGGRLYQLWRRNLQQLHVPNGAINLAELIIAKIKSSPAITVLSSEIAQPNSASDLNGKPPPPKKLLLCDFHTHTTWSDGKLSVRELVDFYGQRRFDCLCITDHLCDPKRLLGKLVNLTGLVIPPGELVDYFAEIEAEKERAWSRYELLLMTGIEFNRDGYRPKTSTHLLGVDLKKPIDPSIPLKQLIAEIKAQGALAIASHPLPLSSKWAKNTLHLWENRDEYAPLLDAWEIANRDDIFNPVGLKKLPIIANSDFHQPSHIHSWKSMLHCAKDAESIKECIRVNKEVYLTLYRQA